MVSWSDHNEGSWFEEQVVKTLAPQPRKHDLRWAIEKKIAEWRKACQRQQS